jgi:4-hydroxy-3-methylbut-2-en-1-yl diphosphate synthase IspG/GcpE
MMVVCDRCLKEWDYKGQNKHTATCPDCRRLVDITSFIEIQAEEENKQEIDSNDTTL